MDAGDPIMFPAGEFTTSNATSGMSTPTVRERVRAVIDLEITDCGPETDDDKSLVGDLGMDSLDRITLADAIEKEFACSISDEEYLAWKTVGDVVRFMETKTRA